MKVYQCQIDRYHGPDEWRTFHCFNSEDAAEEMAELFYLEDPCEPENFEILVSVRRNNGNSLIERFKISAEMELRFHAEISLT